MAYSQKLSNTIEIEIEKENGDILYEGTVNNIRHRAESHFLTIKRSIDIVLALTLFTLLSPLFTIVALVIKLTSEGPVLFSQKRSGLDGREFVMYKFRSMVTNAEQMQSELMTFNMVNGPAFKMKKDPRITEFGRLLRRTSIDELPQLWNVLRGDMSIVGPRPVPVSESNQLESWQKKRLCVKPGLTCLWQISGRSSIVDFDKWIRLDLDYIDRRSLLLDIQILFKTIPVIVSGLGAE